MINVKGLASLLEQTSRAINSMCYTEGLHPAQWSALRYFAKASTRACTVSGLATYQGTTLAPASRTVAALVRKGYLTSTIDRNDRRSRTLAVTEAGNRLLERDPLNDIADMLAGLPAEDQAVMARGLESFLERLAREGATASVAQAEDIVGEERAAQPANGD